MEIGSYFKPNGMKILLSFLLLIPSWLIVSISFVFASAGNFFVGLVSGILIAYVVGCALDNLIKSKWTKIVVASVSTFVSLWLLSRFIMGSVSEYAHVPSECELACREIYEKAANRTPEVTDKVQECLKDCYR